MTLLEYNASPDFHQSGDRFRPELLEMFKGVIEISIAPFFGIVTGQSPLGSPQETTTDEKDIGVERMGWRLIGKGEVRGPSGGQ